MERKNKYLSVIVFLVALIILLAFSWYGDNNITYSIDESDPMQNVDLWKPYENKDIDYGVALRILILRDKNSHDISWIYKLEKYPNDYLAKAGFFDEIKLSGENLWLLVTDKISKSEIVAIDLDAKKITARYSIPNQSSVFIGMLNTEKLFIVISINVNETEKLILYNLTTEEQIILDTAMVKNENSFASQWQYTRWINDATLEYITQSGEKKIIDVHNVK